MEGLGDIRCFSGKRQVSRETPGKNNKSMRLPRKPVVSIVFLLELFSMIAWWQETLHLLEQMDASGRD